MKVTIRYQECSSEIADAFGDVPLGDVPDFIDKMVGADVFSEGDYTIRYWQINHIKEEPYLELIYW